MEAELFIRYIADLHDRCERNCSVTGTAFLTPAEQAEAERAGYANMIFHGGVEGCERRAAFFLPYYMEREDFDPQEYLSAVKTVARFAAPGHRDFLGAVLALGVRREFLGDY